MPAALTSRASLPPMREAPTRTIRKLSLGSSKSILAFVSWLRSLSCSEAADAPPHRYSINQLENVASLLHCKLGELGGHLEQAPYAHEIWRAQL